MPPLSLCAGEGLGVRVSRLTPDVYGRWPVLEALRAGHVERVYVAREE